MDSPTEFLTMKKIILLLYLLILTTAMFAQSDYYNEWIDFDKTYYKIKLNRDGLYRIPTATLEAEGVPTTGAHFQMYHKGKEVPIYVTTPDSFGADDYIEFYGEENDGELDSLLFIQTGLQTTPQASLFTDTAAYFLTVDETAMNKRYVPTANEIVSPPPKEDYFIYKSERINDNIHSRGVSFRLGGVSNNYADFEKGEGFVGSLIQNGASQSYSINTEGLYADAGDAILTTKIIGRSNEFGVLNDHPFEIAVNGTNYLSANFEGIEVYGASFPVLVSDLVDGQSSVSFTALLPASIPGLTVNTLAVAYTSITYPHSFDFGNDRSFNFEIANDSDKYLEITNFNAGSQPVLYDLTNGLRMLPVIDNSGGTTTYQFLLSQVAGGADFRNLLLVNTTSALSIKTVNAMKPVQFTDFSQAEAQGNYLIISHTKLMQPDSNYVQAYKDYRSSTDGGGYVATVANIEELYDQFAWGILKHPLAIRHFINYAYDNWDTQPDYLLLLGKSVAYNETTLNPTAFNRCLIPTYGEPPSDIMLTTSSIFSFRNRLATGRIPAFYNYQVKDYLDKLMLYEAARNAPCTKEDRLWMKNAMHIAGGNNLSQANEFVNTLNQYKDIYEDVEFGGNVVVTYNNLISGAVVEADLGNYINDGLAIINFVGHSSGSYWSVDLRDPFAYENYGKYPFIVTSSCFVGDIHFYDPNAISMAEDYVLAKDVGAIGFLASATIGFPTFLDIYTEELYHNFCKDHYNSPIGMSIKRAIATTDAAYTPPDPKVNGVKLTSQEYSLAGDPAIIINSFDNPEYIIEDSDVSFLPPEITADLDSFAIQVIVTNLGRAVADSFNVFINRQLPDGSTEVVTEERLPSTHFRDTLTFYIQTGDVATVAGDNGFTVTIDQLGEITEDCEDNNAVAKNLFILSDVLVPIAPCDFAIVSDPNVQLQAATGLPLLDALDYEMQLDTSITFDSPFLTNAVINSEGGVISWQPNIAFENNTVYYWRASRVPDAGEDYTWKGTSFVFKEGGQAGWNQSHFHQFQTNNYASIILDSLTRHFRFTDLDNTIFAQNTYNIDNKRTVRLNGDNISQPTCLNSDDGCGGGLSFTILKPGLELSPLVSEKQGGSGTSCDGVGSFDNIHCFNLDRFDIEFHTNDVAQLDNMMAFLDNEVPDGYYVLISSIGNHHLRSTDVGAPIQAYKSAIFQFLENMGISNAENVITDLHFIAFGRKNDPTFSNEIVLAPAISDSITYNKTLNSIATQGTISSPLIGPSLQWGSIEWTMENLETTDAVSFDIYGVNGDTETLLLTAESSIIDLSGIDAAAYPFLKMEMTVKDSMDFTLPQLDSWQVYFTRMPEIALNKQAHFVFQSDTLQAGEALHVEIALTNTGETASDSVLVQYTIIDQNNQEQVLNTPLLPPIGIGETVIATLDYTTENLIGTNLLVIDVNPNHHQPEKLDFNNILFRSFFVEQDVLNPVLDVTFDGTHILNGDLVSAEPTIAIRVKDENRFLALNDPDDFDMALLYPNETAPTPIDFSDAMVTFTPASETAAAEGNNTAQIQLTPTFTQDGDYQLILTAKDRSDNTFANNEAFNVSFKVITTPMISKIVNYPNPFTSQTQFVFTLTGSEIPEFMKIQIMTVSGKVVREIRESELGALRIGNNITEFAWDGTDEFGNELANGLYLYRVVARLNGQDMDNYDTNADGFFKKNIGKMYLMR